MHVFQTNLVSYLLPRCEGGFVAGRRLRPSGGGRDVGSRRRTRL